MTVADGRQAGSSPCARVQLVLLLAALAVAPWPAEAFLDKLNPFTDTKDEFEGRFIDSITPHAWVSPRERLRQQQEARARQGVSAGGGKEKEFDDPLAAPPPDPAKVGDLRDGLTLLRMDEEGLIKAPALQTYLKGIVARLLAVAPVSGAPIRIHITASGDYGDAKAMPDGVIGLPLGVIRQADSEDELAALLGHEIAHVLLGHHGIDWYEKTHESMVSAAEIGLGMMMEMAKKTGAPSAKIGAKMAKPLFMARASLKVTQTALFPSWAREQEDEADLLGLDLALAAGYNGYGMFEVMSKLVAWEEAQIPTPEERERLRTEKTQEIEAQAEKGDFFGAFGSALGAMSSNLGSVFEDLEARHRAAEARDESLIDYYDREYAELTPPAMRTENLGRLRKTKESTALFAGYDAADEAFDQLEDGATDKVEGLARRGVRGQLSNHAWPRYVFYITRLRQGLVDKARKNLEIALTDDKAPLIIYRALAILLRDRGKAANSLVLLERAWAEFKDPPALYPDLIYGYWVAGKGNKANQLALECRIKARAAAEVCAAAATGHKPQ